MDWAGDVAVTVRLGHINDEHSVDVCFVVIGCEMVEISAKVGIRVWYRAWWEEKGFSGGRELSRFVFGASVNPVV